jgi:hypothetical protein
VQAHQHVFAAVETVSPKYTIILTDICHAKKLKSICGCYCQPDLL